MIAADRSPDPVADLLHRTRAERGLPPMITDRATLERVAAVLRSADRRGGGRQ